MNISVFGFTRTRQFASIAVLASFIFTNVFAVDQLRSDKLNTVSSTSAAKYTTDLTQLGREGRLREDLSFENETTQLLKVLAQGGIRQPVMGAGRTDAGVHATGQVIAFTYLGTLSAEALMEALNGMLPPDVAIRGVRRAPAGFNPRYAARYREYRYTIWNGPRSPLRERTSLWVRSELDVTAMAEAATAFEGRHDSFGSRLHRGDLRVQVDRGELLAELRFERFHEVAVGEGE